jgi:hypothetical protein
MTDRVPGLEPRFPVWFANTFGGDFPVRLRRPLRHVRESFWVDDRMSPVPAHPPMTPDFEPDRPDYLMAGRWGHGVQSHAFYWIDVDAAHRCFFRLPHGGAYSDEEADIASVRAFLEGYAAFVERTRPTLRRSVLVCDMGACFAELERVDREPVVEESDELGQWWSRLTLALLA